MADNIYKHTIGGKVSPVVPHTDNPTHAVPLSQVKEVSNPIANADNPYTSEAAMWADQPNQTNRIYKVTGVGLFYYLGTTTASADDYDVVERFFTPIAEDEYGTHPAFSDQHNFNVWVLGKISGGGDTATQLNAPEPITATSAGGDSILINWTDTNS